MKDNSELNHIQDVMNQKYQESQIRSELLKQLKGLNYWLYLLGL